MLEFFEFFKKGKFLSKIIKFWSFRHPVNSIIIFETINPSTNLCFILSLLGFNLRNEKKNI